MCKNYLKYFLNNYLKWFLNIFSYFIFRTIKYPIYFSISKISFLILVETCLKVLVLKIVLAPNFIFRTIKYPIYFSFSNNSFLILIEICLKSWLLKVVLVSLSINCIISKQRLSPHPSTGYLRRSWSRWCRIWSSFTCCEGRSRWNFEEKGKDWKWWW